MCHLLKSPGPRRRAAARLRLRGIRDRLENLVVGVEDRELLLGVREILGVGPRRGRRFLVRSLAERVDDSPLPLDDGHDVVVRLRERGDVLLPRFVRAAELLLQRGLLGLEAARLAHLAALRALKPSARPAGLRPGTAEARSVLRVRSSSAAALAAVTPRARFGVRESRDRAGASVARDSHSSDMEARSVQALFDVSGA